MPATDVIELSLAFSPDPDDAFMWWAMVEAAEFDTGRFRITPHLADIETLNDQSERGVYDITAISAAQYARVSSTYAITSCGCSMGEGYGPKLVARRAMSAEEISGGDFPIATPGARTTASLITAMMLGIDDPHARFVPVSFETVIDRVAGGDYEAGVVIHEGQLTFEDSGLHLVADVGTWWHDRFALPLPLGLNVVRRNLAERCGSGALMQIATLLRASIDYGLDHRDEAIAYAMNYGRGITVDQADEFVHLYVSGLTREMGEHGEEAIRTLVAEAQHHGIAGPDVSVDVIRPGSPFA